MIIVSEAKRFALNRDALDWKWDSSYVCHKYCRQGNQVIIRKACPHSQATWKMRKVKSLQTTNEHSVSSWQREAEAVISTIQ